MPVHDDHQVEKTPGHGNVGDVRRPHLVGSGDLHAPQQIWVDLVPRRRLAGPRPPVDGRKPDGPHEPLDPLPVHLVTLSVEPNLHASRAVEWRSQVLLVHTLHQGQVFLGRVLGPIVDTRSANTQQGALPDSGQGPMLTVHHLPPPLPPHGPDLFAKKSRSTFICPIC